MLQVNSDDIKNTAKEFEKIFIKNSWTWLASQVPPNRYEIEETIRRLVGNLNNNPDTIYSETGRIRVSRDDDNKSVSIICIADTQSIRTTEVLEVETNIGSE